MCIACIVKVASTKAQIIHAKVHALSAFIVLHTLSLVFLVRTIASPATAKGSVFLAAKMTSVFFPIKLLGACLWRATMIVRIKNANLVLLGARFANHHYFVSLASMALIWVLTISALQAVLKDILVIQSLEFVKNVPMIA